MNSAEECYRAVIQYMKDYHKVLVGNCGSKKGLGVEEKLEFLNFALYRNITKSYSSEPSPLFSPPLEKISGSAHGI